MDKSKLSPAKLAISGLLIGISVLGSYISLPMPGIGSTIAFDSLPGFFGALYLSPMLGAVIGAIGHLMTAIIHGFPQGIQSHMVVMIFMGIACASFGFLYSKQKIVAVIVAYMFNGPVTLFLASWIAYVMSMTPTLMFLFYMLILPLSLAALANILLAAGLYEAIGKRLR